MIPNLSTTQQITKRVEPTTGGLVSSQHSRASRIGAEVLEAGGNAMDAAVAVGFALGVAEPWMSGPGGGGAMVVWNAAERRAYAVNFGMRSPAGLDVADYPVTGDAVASDLFPWPVVKEDRNVLGATAIAVPGMVAGMATGLDRFGTMDWADLLQPAIALAHEGPVVDWYSSLLIGSSAQMIARDADLAAIFLDDGTWPKVSGWTEAAQQRLDMSGMAATLDHLARAGAQDFYSGDIAQALAADVQAKGGSLSRFDLAEYQAQVLEPLAFDRGAARVHAMPGLTAGPTLADYFARLPMGSGMPDEVQIAMALRGAYDHRLQHMGHDGETHDSPGCTSHFSVVDRDGNMVSVTQTLLSIFGARVLSPSTGLLMNNGIMWFDPEQGKPNSLAPGQPCLMNICPIIVTTPNGGFALGASGGRKILGAVAQVATAMLDGEQSLAEAFHRPRIDCAGDMVIADEALGPERIEALRQHFPVTVQRNTAYPFAWACPSAVQRWGNSNLGCTEVMNPWADTIGQTDL